MREMSTRQHADSVRRYPVHLGRLAGSLILPHPQRRKRIDKIFLDKYLLSKLLQRNVPVIAVFLHDVQRAKRGQSIFGINSTFKTNHFLGYTAALNKLDGVYYIDFDAEMLKDDRLRQEIQDFQKLLTTDLWTLIN